MSHYAPSFVAVRKEALEHLLKCALMVDDFHELRHAAEAVKKGAVYNDTCAELERRDERYCIRE